MTCAEAGTRSQGAIEQATAATDLTDQKSCTLDFQAACAIDYLVEEALKR